MASQITSLIIVYSNIYSGADQKKYQSSASLAFVRGIHRWPVNFPHKGPVTRKMLPFNDVIMTSAKNIGAWTKWLMTHSNAFSWIKILVFWFKFHWNLYLGVQLTIRHWLGAAQGPIHYLNQLWQSCVPLNDIKTVMHHVMMIILSHANRFA